MRKDTPARRKYMIWKVSEARRKLKLRAIEYKGGACSVCGYDKHVAALQFHHLDPTIKEHRIGGVVRSWARLKIEVDKCVLLCANCHAELHGVEADEKSRTQEAEVRALVPERRKKVMCP